jgi:hypothetical protein
MTKRPQDGHIIACYKCIIEHGLSDLVAVLQLLMLQPGVVRQESDPPSLKALVMDPYIIVAAGKAPILAVILLFTP